jgi:hypothetical protein
MKRQPKTGKLTIDVVTVRKLEEPQLAKVAGGYDCSGVAGSTGWRADGYTEMRPE